MSGRGPNTGRPYSITLPVVGGNNPAMIFNKVDFPQPEEPMMETNSR